VIKSANMCVQGVLGIELGINLPTGYSMQFLLYWQASHLSTYCFTSLVTLGYQKFQVTSSIVFYCPLCPPTNVL